jgi:hypothetical protein
MAEEIIKVKVDLDVEIFNKNAKAMSDALSKVLGKDVEIFNGKIGKTTKLLNDSEKAFNSAGAAANRAGSNLKQTNQQWTNLALVIQDLPYGFRGIQNNLPALVGGFAALTGPIYLAASAIIALFTAIDSGLIKFGNAIKLNTDFSKEAATMYSNQATEMQSLYRVATDANRPMQERILAAKALKEEYPGLLKVYSEEEIALGKAETAYKQLNQVLWQYAMAKAAGKALDELAIKQFDIDTRRDKAKTQQQAREIKAYKEVKALTLDQMSFTQRLGKTINDLPTAMIQFPMLLGAMKKSEDILTGIEQEQKILNVEKEKYLKILDDNITAEQKLKDSKEEGKKGKTKIEDNSIALLKSQQQYYKDNIIMFAMYEQEIIRRQADLDIRQAQAEKKSADYIKNIRLKRDQDIINSAKDLSDKLSAIQAKLGEEEGKALQEEADLIAKGRKMINDGLLAINQKFLNDDIDSLERANQVRVKLDRGNLRRQIADYQEHIKKLELLRQQALESGTGVDVSGIDKKIKIAQAAIEGLGSTWLEVSKKINTSITGALSSSFEILGEAIGNALAGKKFDAISALGNTLATALTEIGKALIAFAVMEGIALQLFSNPASWPVALAAGVAAVAAGAYLRAKMGGGAGSGSGGGGSVNYGNVNSATAAGAYMPNRPGFGLFGQSPNSTIGNDMSSIANAQNMSANSSTFVLKGQDLLLSVNRAQKASQLKGQNINLAG